MNTPESLEEMAGELVRRGLPAEYAKNAVAELSDHHQDLVAELRAGGRSAFHAAEEASRRLGDARNLVKKIVRGYQQRYWYARWPLITFFISPLPLLIVAWLAIGYTLWFAVWGMVGLGLITATDADAAFTGLPVTVKYITLVALFLIAPSAVLSFFWRLTKRAALGWKWILLTACVLGLGAGECKWERIGPGSKLVMTDRHTGHLIPHPPKPDFVLTLWIPYDLRWQPIRQFFFSNVSQPCQLLLPIVLAALFLLRQRQASRGGLLACGNC